MKLTITQKISFGIAGLLLFAGALNLVLYRAQQHLRVTLERVVDVEEPISAVAYEMEINVVEFGLKVLKYLATRDPELRPRALKDTNDFERVFARYVALATEAEDKALARRVYNKYDEFKRMGFAIMDRADEQEHVFREIAANFLRMEALIDDKLVPKLARGGPGAFDRMRLLKGMDTNLAEINVWLAHYLRLQDSAYKDLLARDTEEFQVDLARYKTYRLSRVEARTLQEIENLFAQTRVLIERKLESNAAMNRHEARFVELRVALDNVLDEEIQKRALARLQSAKEEVNRSANVSTILLLILLPALVVAGAGAALLIIQLIKKPIEDLAIGVRVISDGDLAHRVPVHGGDELATLAQEFNRMAAALEHNSARTAAINRDLESFTYSVAHDLRSPLRAISGFSRVFLDRHGAQLAAEARGLIERVDANTKKMGHLIDDLLEFARIGQQPIHASEIDMGALANEVVRELAPHAPGRAPEIVVRPLPPARGDRALLRQVLTNLVANAIKYSSTRERPAIEIAGNAAAAETVYSVADNGVGFDMQYYDKLFGVFQRLHDADEFPGAGVGLAIVQRVVARHDGRVWAQGKPGAGATFHFSLPA